MDSLILSGKLQKNFYCLHKNDWINTVEIGSKENNSTNFCNANTKLVMVLSAITGTLKEIRLGN